MIFKVCNLHSGGTFEQFIEQFVISVNQTVNKNISVIKKKLINKYIEIQNLI